MAEVQPDTTATRLPEPKGGMHSSKGSSESLPPQISSGKAASAAESSDHQLSLWSSIFTMSVCFPKFVCINNARLTVLYYLLTFLLVLGIIWYFLVNSQYNIEKSPFAMVHLCSSGGTQCRRSMADTAAAFDSDSTSDVCTNPQNYKYWASPHAKWDPIGCVRMCGSQTSADPIGTLQDPGTCILPTETILLSPQMAFVPTYISDSTYLLRNGSCPVGYATNGNACSKRVDHFVPGAGKQTLRFAHEFSVSPEMAAFVFSKQDKKGLSMSASSQPWDDGLKTVLYAYDGQKVAEWSAGSWIEPTIDDLLAAADYDDVGPSGPLSLDQVYNRVDYGVLPNTMPNAPKGGVSLRMTGVTLTLDVAITDNGKCHHVKLGEDFDVGSGPVACMFAHAERTWTQEGSQYKMGTDGSYKEIQRSGVRIKFRPKGSIQMFDITTVMQSFTVAVVWIQIPLVIVYYFTVICLGHLSSVYSRVINQELSLGNACKGLAARLVSHSAAYMDLQDTPEGISKSRLADRFKKILDSRIKNGELQTDEIENYVNYVFEGMQSLSESGEVVINDSINIQEFCQACCTNEPLSFEALVALFDKDRSMNCLEQFFLDDTIRGVISESKKTLKEKLDTPQEATQREEAMLVDSVLRMKTCSDQVEELEGICHQIVKKASTELEQQSDLSKKAAEIAIRRRAEGKSVIDPIHDFTPTEDPKPDQRESACSVADEEEPGKGYWNEV